MLQVLYALAPISLAAVYFFGWRVGVMLGIANGVGFLMEYLFTRAERQPVTSAVFVTNTLFVLSLPPTLPLWMVAVGAAFAVAFGKMMFGGFGRNVFNPALVGRAFLYVSFGGHMTGLWGVPLRPPLGGLTAYAPDAIASATPGMLLKTGGAFSFTGFWIGLEPGTIGGTSALLALLCGLYLVWRKVANGRIVLAAVAGFLAVQGALWRAGVPRAAEPFQVMLSGSFLFGAFFFATEPVTASKHPLGRWIYGAFIGAMSSLIGIYSIWPAGTMFAILLANMFAPIMDYGLKQWDQARKAKAAVPATPDTPPAKGAMP
jgi:Na+-transporting NADH:ubiquinone oxidoreductase subunit B